SSMKLVLSAAVRCQFAERRHLTWATKCTWLSEADIVEQDDDDVWRPIRRFHFKARACLSITNVKLSDGGPLRLGDRQHGPINLLRRQRQRQQAQYTSQH